MSRTKNFPGLVPRSENSQQQLSREWAEFAFFLPFSLPRGHYISTGLRSGEPPRSPSQHRSPAVEAWLDQLLGGGGNSVPPSFFISPPSLHPRPLAPSLPLSPSRLSSGFRRSEWRAPCSSPGWELKCRSGAPGTRAPERPARVEGPGGALSFGGSSSGPSGLGTARRGRTHYPPAWPAQQRGVREPERGRQLGGGQPGAEGRVPSGLARRRAPPGPASARSPRQWPAEPCGLRVLSASSPRRGACLRLAAPPRCPPRCPGM